MVHHQQWIFAGTPPSYPVVALCLGDPPTLDQQDWPFHAFQQFTDDVDLGMGQLKALDLDLGATELVSPLALPYPYHQGKLSSTRTDSDHSLKLENCRWNANNTY